MKISLFTFLLCMFYSSNIFSQAAKTTKPVAKTTTKAPVKKKTTKPVKTVKAPVKTAPSFLLVKIKSDIFINSIGALTIREGIEDKIDEQLTAAKNGEWISGDSGPGEINILYKVQNVDVAMKIILKVVNEEKFAKTIIMGIRTYFEKGQSKYKAIYPVGYNGTL